MPLRQKVTWEDFSLSVRDVAHMRGASPRRDQRLVEDLGLDSLALAELAVFLIVDLEVDTFASTLHQREWRGVTLGELYDEYCSGRNSPSPARTFIMDSRP